jgi:predicted GNAT family N-acyltransferase
MLISIAEEGHYTPKHCSQNAASHFLRDVSTHLCLCVDGSIAGFKSLKTVIVNTIEMDSKMRKGPSEGQSTGILLCQMGLAHGLRGNGHGKMLLHSAIGASVAAHRLSSVNLLIVDAANERLADWYEEAGLVRVPDSLRLVQRMPALSKLFPQST